MKTTTIKNFSGLTYVTITNVPVKRTNLGDVIDMNPRELERLVSSALIENKVPIRGMEFRVMKSALGLSNEVIGKELGISRNTVLKWGKNLETRLPIPYEMLFRVLVADVMKLDITPTMAGLRTLNKTKRINIKAAS